MQTGTTSIIAYGKLLLHGDFVRYNANGQPLRDLDEWLQRGLYVAKSQLGAQFDAVYDATPAYRFLYSSKSPGASIVGVMRPSRDRSRRTFPFLIAAETVAYSADPRMLVRTPVRFEAFLEQADVLTTDIVSGHIPHREIGERLEQSGLANAAVEGSSSPYERYLRETTLGTWCESHWGFFDDSRKYHLFRNLLQLLEPLDGRIPSGFTLGLDFPLADDGSPEGGAAFWLDLCFHLLGFPDVTPVCFWTRETSVAGRGRFILFFRPPGAHAMPHLLQGESEGDHLYNLETASDGAAANAALAIPSRIGALLESDDLSLGDFLASLRES